MSEDWDWDQLENRFGVPYGRIRQAVKDFWPHEGYLFLNEKTLSPKSLDMRNYLVEDAQKSIEMLIWSMSAGEYTDYDDQDYNAQEFVFEEQRAKLSADGSEMGESLRPMDQAFFPTNTHEESSKHSESDLSQKRQAGFDGIEVTVKNGQVFSVPKYLMDRFPDSYLSILYKTFFQRPLSVNIAQIEPSTFRLILTYLNTFGEIPFTCNCEESTAFLDALKFLLLVPTEPLLKTIPDSYFTTLLTDLIGPQLPIDVGWSTAREKRNLQATKTVHVAKTFRFDIPSTGATYRPFLKCFARPSLCELDDWYSTENVWSGTADWIRWCDQCGMAATLENKNLMNSIIEKIIDDEKKLGNVILREEAFERSVHLQWIKRAHELEVEKCSGIYYVDVHPVEGLFIWRRGNFILESERFVLNNTPFTLHLTMHGLPDRSIFVMELPYGFILNEDL